MTVTVILTEDRVGRIMASLMGRLLDQKEENRGQGKMVRGSNTTPRLGTLNTILGASVRGTKIRAAPYEQDNITFVDRAYKHQCNTQHKLSLSKNSRAMIVVKNLGSSKEQKANSTSTKDILTPVPTLNAPPPGAGSAAMSTTSGLTAAQTCQRHCSIRAP